MITKFSHILRARNLCRAHIGGHDICHIAEARQPEVAYLDIEAVIDEQVGALEVAVDDGRVVLVQVNQPTQRRVQHLSHCG